MKQLKFLFSVVFIWLTFGLKAQNSIWLLPPYYYVFPAGPLQYLPTPGAPGGLGTPGLDYDGSPAQFCHNAMQDANGNLLFFIIDGVIYDKDGYLIDRMDNSVGEIVAGYSNVAIVPDPANCKRFYVIANHRKGVPYGQSFNNSLYYTIVDMSMTNVYDTTRLGAIDNTNPNINFDNNIVDVTYGSYDKQNLLFTVVKAQNANYYYIYATDLNYAGVYRYKIDQNGLYFDNYLSNAILVSNTFNPINIRAELEVVPLSNGNYRIAGVTYYQDPNNYQVNIADIDQNGNIITNSVKTVILSGSTQESPTVHGLEFSPNGDYLYITHKSTSTYPSCISYINVTQNNPTVQNLNVSNNFKFEHSYIELAKNNKLYFISDNVMASLSNPDNPNPVNWSINPLNFTYNYNYGTQYTNPSYSDRLLTYILPSQIDGMDYSAYATVNTECCLFYSTSSFDVQDYTANTGTQIWQPGNGQNPFNSISGTVQVNDKLEIPAGATVTIKNMTFEFAPNAYVEVQRGGKLILDNSTFTVYQGCGNDVLWQGVYVAGTPNAFQGYTANRGWLQLQNNSVIERAHTAAHNYARTTSGGIDWAQVGGVIRSNNSSFKNNIRDVEFLAFSNLNPTTGVRINDLSRFTKTNFITDNTLASINKWPGYHVTMWNVKGIVFSGCTFENTVPSSYNTGQQGSGIYSIDAVYTVTRKCNTPFNCSNATNSAFNNLYYGIRSFAGTNGYTVNVSYTDFDNNWRAVYLRGMQYPQVVENTFNVGENRYNSVSPPNVSYGLYLHNSTGYKVENNLFNTTHNGYMGIYVNNSGTGPNKIYRNEFYGLTVGTQTFKTNGDNLSSVSQQGLEYQCNNFYDIKDYDIFVSNGTIKNQQGLCGTSDKSPANNLFSYTASLGDYWLANAPNVTVFSTYNYRNTFGYPNLEPRSGMYNNTMSSVNDCSLSPANTPPYNPSTSCPNKIPTGGIININLRKAEFNAFKQQADSLQALIDGGNTKALLQIINDTVIPAWQKRNTLIDASPYLSDVVLQALIKSYPTTPQWVIQQVLSQNAPLSETVLMTLIEQTPKLPDYVVRNMLLASYPVSDRVIGTLLKSHNHFADWVISQVLIQNSPLSNQNLKYFIQNNYPAYMVKNVLMQNSPLSADVYDVLITHTPAYPNWAIRHISTTGTVEEHYVYKTPNLSPRMELDMEIAHLQSEMYFAKADIIRACLFDTTGVLTEKDAIAFLEQQSCKKDQCSLTGLCISAKDYTKANQYIDSLATDTATQNLANYYTSVINVKQQNIKEEAAVKTDNSVHNTFNAFANNFGQVSVLAASVLEFFTDTSTVEEVYIPVSNANARTSNTETNEGNNDGNLKGITNQNITQSAKVYPNPASNSLYVEINGVQFLNTQVEISDVAGKVLLNVQVNSNINKIDLTSLPNGIYLVTVKENEAIIKTSKLIIVK